MVYKTLTHQDVEAHQEVRCVRKLLFCGSDPMSTLLVASGNIVSRPHTKGALPVPPIYVPSPPRGCSDFVHLFAKYD